MLFSDSCVAIELNTLWSSTDLCIQVICYVLHMPNLYFYSLNASLYFPQLPITILNFSDGSKHYLEVFHVYFSYLLRTYFPN